MAVVKVVLLVVAVAGALARPRSVPLAAVPLAAAALGLGTGAVSLGLAGRALRPLAGPLAFVLAAVPLAVLLDELGFFDVLAGALAARSRPYPGLWLLAAFVTAVFNLDAAVVLLTPLYLRVARRRGLDPVALGVQPVVLALLASSALPVSNLTNLIAVARTGVGPVAFLVHLGPPSLVAVTVGYALYRRAFGLSRAAVGHDPPRTARPGVRTSVDPVDAGGGGRSRSEKRALVVGGLVVAVLLVGFLAGPLVGVAPFEVVAALDAVLVVALRRLPLSAVPWQTALVAASLALLAAAAVAGHEPRRLLEARSALGAARTMVLVGVASNLLNNLPAMLLSLPALGRGQSLTLWAVLLGVNMGPALAVSGSLASLLWMDLLGRFGVRMTPGRFFRLGLSVGLPAAVAAGALLVALGR